MPARCDNCASLFFKTLETRVDPMDGALLSKKRCKRCKFKYLFALDPQSGTVQRVELSRWRAAEPLVNDGRARVFASEYTMRVSRGASEMGPYLERVARAARGGRHDAS